MINKELILKAITAIFIDRDISAFDKYFSENYIQHNPEIPNGTEVLKQLIPKLTSRF